jgi:NADH dehydrogenase
VAKALIARAKGKTLPPFRYRDFGMLATVGRKQAVAHFGKVRLSGFLAWLIWSVAHIYFLIGFRNRLVVAMNWTWNYLTFQRGTRLITGITGSRIEDVVPPMIATVTMHGGALPREPAAPPTAPMAGKIGGHDGAARAGVVLGPSRN